MNLIYFHLVHRAVGKNICITIIIGSEMTVIRKKNLRNELSESSLERDKKYSRKIRIKISVSGKKKG